MAFFGTMHGIPHFNDPSESQSPPALSRGLMPLFDVQMEAEETAEGMQFFKGTGLLFLAGEFNCCQLCCSISTHFAG